MNSPRPIPIPVRKTTPNRLFRWLGGTVEGRAEARATNHPSRRRGFSLMEILVALAVASILLVAVMGTFLTLLSFSKSSEVQLQALANARAALETMSREIKAAAGSPHPVYFVGEDHPTQLGDGRDNDGDGRVDEEQPDGRDNDGDWDKKENHVAIGGLKERPHQPSNQADLGETGVDEDCVFHHDRLSFRVAAPAGSDHLYEDVTYEMLTPPNQFDGQSYVLTRTTSFTLTSDSTQSRSVTAPVAYGALSFSCLYWDSNSQPADQYWKVQWDSRTSTGPLKMPASVYVELVMYADKKPLEEYREGSPVNTLNLRTVVNIESVIQSSAFPRDP